MTLFGLLFCVGIDKKTDMAGQLHYRLKPFLWMIALLLGCRLWGLNPETSTDQYLIDSWTTTEGLPSNTILSIAQTPDGYLWIATSKGLVRFDGLRFSTSPLAHQEKPGEQKPVTPITLFTDQKGILWIGSIKGLTSYRYQTGQIETFTSSDGLGGDHIRRIQEDSRGNLWVSLFVGNISRISEGQITTFNASNGLFNNKINAIIEDRSGRLLFGSRENGVFQFRDGRFFKFPIPGLDHLYIITMFEDRTGVLWIGTHKGIFKTVGKKIEAYTIRDGLSHNYITGILEDSERRLWIGTMKGLSRVEDNGETSIGFESILKDFLISCLFEDREKNLWVGTYNSGLKRLKDGKLGSYAPVEAYRDEIFISLFEDRLGDIWLGTMSGKLFHCRGLRVIETIAPTELAGTGITAIAEDPDGNLWLGTIGKGVLKKEKGGFIQFTTSKGLADNMVTSIFKDSRGDLWLSTFGGLNLYHHTDGLIVPFHSQQGLLGKKVHNVYEDRDHNFWIATNKGVVVMKNGSTGAKADIYLDGVPISCIYEDPSNRNNGEPVTWIATYGAGLNRLNRKNGKITAFTKDEGMPTDFISQFFEDHQGNFWLMSANGILRVSKIELERWARGESNEFFCTAFGIADGMKSTEADNQFSRHSALNTSSGELWFVTKNGISIVNPEKIRFNKQPPPVVIEEFLVDRQPVSLHLDPESYTFKGDRDILFRFTAPTFLSSQKVRFKYLLEPIDDSWNLLVLGRERAVNYSSLTPGTYTFRLSAANVDGIWNPSGTSLTFTLKPHLYQTLFFKIATLLLTVFLLAVALYIYKKRPFKKRKKYQSTINPLFAHECIRKLDHLMKAEKVYCDETLSLTKLADKLSISPHQLSQLLNEKIERSFSDYINYHRIEAAKRILLSPEAAEKKITSLAHDVGFNTMTAFYNAFKKHTAMTPIQYRKKFGQKR